MADYTTLARPYAKAAFEYAAEKNAIASWGLCLKRASFIVKDERINKLLLNPLLERRDKLDLLVSICDGKLDSEQRNLFALLADFNRLLVVPKIADLFELLVKDHEQMVDVEVTSAFGLDELEKDKLQKALQIRLNKQVSMTLKEDANLIGGAIIRAGDFVIDGSILGKLTKMRKLLLS